MQKIKIAWVNPSFLDYRVPVYAKLNELSEDGLHVIYSASRTPVRVHCKITKEIGYNAIPLHFEKSLYFGDLQSDLSNKSYRIPYPKQLYKHLKKIKPDVVIAEGFFQWTLYALIYSIFHNKKIYISYERTKYTERNCGKVRTLYRVLIAKLAAGFLVNGDLTKEYCTDILNIKDNKIITKCMAAGNFNVLPAVPEKKEFGKVRFLFVGQLVARKGLREFLDVICGNRDELRTMIQINIVGEGPESANLKGLCQRNELDFVNFIGSVEHDNISLEYYSNDVFFLPTLEDNWSLVIPEAMAHRLPVATTPYNGCHKELIQHKRNGYVFDIKTGESVMEMIRFFILNREQFREMGRVSHEIQNPYTAEKVANRIFDFVRA